MCRINRGAGSGSVIVGPRADLRQMGEEDAEILALCAVLGGSGGEQAQQILDADPIYQKEMACMLRMEVFACACCICTGCLSCLPQYMYYLCCGGKKKHREAARAGLLRCHRQRYPPSDSDDDQPEEASDSLLRTTTPNAPPTQRMGMGFQAAPDMPHPEHVRW